MPYYQPMNYDEWAKRGKVFYMVDTKSGMGIITNEFYKMPNVYKSMHSIKSVCVWEVNAENIIKNHEVATTPFFWDAQYGKF